MPRNLSFLCCLLCPVGALAQATSGHNNGMPANRFAHQADWWKHAALYEIYPRSYADSSNDGTGDLNGITRHLDYLQALGIDAIWITPMFPSPQVDFGYDVSDYEAVDPQYGTMHDLEQLISEAGKRDIKVVLDLVVNHTSDQHAWFKESRSSRTNPYRDFYIWRDGKGQTANSPGQPPTNWISEFGGSAWKFDAQTRQWYYHDFYAEQPDLNWRNPKVEQAMFDIVRRWFKRGIYGFRLDAVDTLFEDPSLHDNPTLPEKDAYGEYKQRKIYNTKLPEVHTELQKLRGVVDEFSGRVLIGETWTSKPEESHGLLRTSQQRAAAADVSAVDHAEIVLGGHFPARHRGRRK